MDGTIRDYKIQRSRERGTKEIKKDEFRSQFTQKKVGDAFVLPSSKNINVQFITPIMGYQKTSSIIAYSAHKTLYLNYVVFGEIIREAQTEA